MEFIGQFHEQRKKMELDLLDRKIFYLLSINGRFAESSIAKALKTSKEVVHYRIKRMINEGFLHGFITFMDAQKLGHTVHSVNLSLHPFYDHKEMVEKLTRDGRINHIKHYNSLQYLQFGVATETVQEFVGVFENILDTYHGFIKDYNISTILEEHYLGLGFLLAESERPHLTERKGSSFQKEFGESAKGSLALDEKDREILSHLRMNGRMPILQLSHKIKLATTSVQKRMENLISHGVIKHVLPYSSLSFLGYQWYTLHVRTKNLHHASFMEFLGHHPNIVWCTKRLGKWNYHISIFAENNTKLMEVVQAVRNQFHSSIIAFDTGVVFKQYKFSSRVM